jgi:hypothetical protein
VQERRNDRRRPGLGLRRLFLRSHADRQQGELDAGERGAVPDRSSSLWWRGTAKSEAADSGRIIPGESSSGSGASAGILLRFPPFGIGPFPLSPFPWPFANPSLFFRPFWLSTFCYWASDASRILRQKAGPFRKDRPAKKSSRGA